MENKLQHIIYGFIVAFVLSACGGPLNKSVTEPLTPEEMETIAKKYNSFKYEYEHKIFPKINKMIDKSLEKQQFKKLTYGDYIKFREYWLNNNWDEQFGPEWEKRFDDEKLTKQLDSMVDSIIQYWDNYIIENGPSTYVSIELLEITKSVSSSWIGTPLTTVSARLKIVPLRGKIDKMSASYTLYRTDKTDPKTYKIGEELGSGTIEIETPFDDPITIESKLSVNNSWMGRWYDYVCNTPVEILKEKCKLHAPLPELIVKGENIDILTLIRKRPSYVYGYKEARNNTASSEYKADREKFIQEYIDKDYYADKSVYISKREYQTLYEYNPLAYDLCFGENGMRY